MESRHVVIVGAGAVGVISAVEAMRSGHRVTVVDPSPAGSEAASSYGNAGWLSAHSVIPPATPGAWKSVPGYLMDPLGPLAVRWRYLPRLAPWLVRYLASGWSEARILETAKALRPLLVEAPALHARLAAEAGVGELVERQGVLHAYPSRADFEADALAWRVRGAVGVRWQELSGDELRQREPTLSRDYDFALLVEESGRCRDPGAYVAALGAHAAAAGARFVAARATGFRFDGERLRAVLTEDGEIACDAAAVCAGARSRSLAAAAGDPVPLETERGYHVVVEGLDAPAPRFTVMAMDRKMIVSPMEGGLRAAGLVEFAGLDATPDWRRADVLLTHMRAILPSLPADIPADRIKRWLGNRPSMPDGRPCLGRSTASADVVYAFGHGHVGLAASARTGRVVAQLLSAQAAEIPLEPFDPRRFLGSRQGARAA